MEVRKHFNSVFKESKYGWKLSKETYMPTLTDSAKSLFSDKELKKYIRDCMLNYDLNMEFFKKLNQDEFNVTVTKFISNYKEFVQLENLDETKNKSGYYIMVLDEYKQLYIGTGQNIYKRLRRHLSENQEYGNLLWGDVFNSKLSINSFRPFDTTRIYVYYTEKIYMFEDEYINYFDDKFVLNRTTGGFQEMGLIGVVEGAKLRHLLNI